MKIKRKKSDDNHAQRLMRLRDQFNRGERLTVKNIREQYQVSRRTVYNYIGQLERMGLPLQQEKLDSQEIQWYIDSRTRQCQLSVTPMELFALVFARRALSLLAKTALWDDLDLALQKAGRSMSSREQHLLASLETKLHMVGHGPKEYGASSEILDTIIDGLMKNLLLKISHVPIGERAQEHLIEPLTLVLYREALYLICFSRTRKEYRTFACERIVEADEYIDEKSKRKVAFLPRKDYQPQKHLNGSFGLIHGKPTEVELLFEADQAPYVRQRKWHRTQKFTVAADGRTRMKMKPSGTDDVMRWLLGQVANVEVVKPDHLREQMRQVLKQALGRHLSGRKSSKA